MSKYEKCFRKSFKIDIETLAISDSSDEERRSVKAPVNLNKGISTRPRKKFFLDGRLTRKSTASELSKIFRPVVTKDFESNWDKDIDLKRTMFKEFIEKASNISASKCKDLLRKQETEIWDMKIQFEKSVKPELEKWKKNLISIQKHEEKLVKVLQELEKVYSLSEAKAQKVMEIRNSFSQRYEELMKIHVLEASDLEMALRKEMSRMKLDVITKMKNRK